MKPAEKPIVVRYKKLGRERVLGLADLDENTIIIDPRQPSRTFTGRNESGYFVGLLKISHFDNAFCSSSICALVRSRLPLSCSTFN